MRATPTPRFLDPRLALALDAVRAIAALMVVTGHMRQIGLYAGPWPFDEMFQHVAVIVFFVLSGLVIAHSTMTGTVTWEDYFVARATRIVPVAFVAVAFGAAAALVPGVREGHAFAQPPWNATLDWQSVTLPLMFLNESIFGTGPPINPPYWSLAYEVWYYILFGIAVFSRGTRRWVLLSAAAIVAGTKILLLMPVWLAGVALARSRPLRALDSIPVAAAALSWSIIAIAVLAEAAAPIKLWLHSVGGQAFDDIHSSQFFIVDWAMTPFVVLGFAALRPLAIRFAGALERVRRPIELSAGSSFTLYALHWPIMSVLAAAGLRTTGPAGWLALVASFQVGAIGVARLTEARRYRLRAALKRLLARGGHTSIDSGVRTTVPTSLPRSLRVSTPHPSAAEPVPPPL